MPSLNALNKITTIELDYNILGHALRDYRFPRSKIHQLLQSGEEAKLRQSGHWPVQQRFDVESFRTWALAKLMTVDIEAAKHDVERFLPDTRTISGWSRELFVVAIEKITA